MKRLVTNRRSCRRQNSLLVAILLVSIVHPLSIQAQSTSPSDPLTDGSTKTTNRKIVENPNPWYIPKSISAGELAALKERSQDGDTEAQFELGLRYSREGYSVVQDSRKAFQLFKAAADKDYAPAELEVARAYREGRGVEKDFSKAIPYNEKAAEHGEFLAITELAIAYSDGKGVPKDLDKAEGLYWQAFSKNEGGAGQYLLSFADEVRYGTRSVAQDVQRSIRIYSRLAEESSSLYADRASDCADRLANIYENGDGVAKDISKAAHWKRVAAEADRKGAEAGEPWAQAAFGRDYLTGDGVLKDATKAVGWLRRSASQGESYAQLLLGSCYTDGDGVPQDFVEAYKWLNLASVKNSGATAQRDFLALRMTPEQIAEAQRRSSRFVAHKESESGAEPSAPGAASVGDSRILATGSGFFITDGGYLVTCYHVIEDANRIALKTKQGAFTAKVVASDKANDIAVLKAEGTFSSLSITASRSVRLGEPVFTIGFPNIDLQGFAAKLTKGEISSVTGAQDDPREFQISVAVQPGNSGGPLVNLYGNVIGIVEARLSDVATLKSTGALPQNVNYALKSSVLNVLLESLPEVSAKLKEPNPTKDRRFEDVVRETENATALVLVY